MLFPDVGIFFFVAPELGEDVRTKGDDLEVVVAGIFNHVVEQQFSVAFAFKFREDLGMVGSEVLVINADGHFAKLFTILGDIEGARTFLVELEGNVGHVAKVGIVRKVMSFEC